MNKKEIEDELKEMAPFLSKIKKDKKEGFSMPANYFERFEDRLMQRIETETALEPKTTPKTDTNNIWSFFRGLLTPKMQYAIGFSVIVIAVLVVLPYLRQDAVIVSEDSSGLLAALSQEEAKSYVVEHVDDFSTEELTATVAVETLNDLQATVDVIVEPAESEQLEELVENNDLDKALETVDEAELDDFSDEMLEEDLDDLF